MEKQVLKRREFLKYIGGMSCLSMGLASLFPGCQFSSFKQDQFSSNRNPNPPSPLPFSPLAPSSQDDFLVAPGFQYYQLIKEGDVINEKGDTFGSNNDYLAFFPIGLSGSSIAVQEGILWVNHEYLHPLLFSDVKNLEERTKAHIDKEQYQVGGSLLHLKRKRTDQRWTIHQASSYNRRLTGKTPIPFSGGIKIAGENVAIGTFANCAGGVTPWKTVLTCEENVEWFYGTLDFTTGKRIPSSWFGWDRFYSYPPEHYGWVVEVDPFTGKAQKHISMGRFAHECATTTKTKDGRVVVYTGDDGYDQCLYKFISHNGKSLEKGTLYVANLQEGRWISLDIHEQPILKKTFKDQTEVLVHTRLAASLVGGTPLDRPEDIEIHPLTQEVFISLTNNPGKGNLYGGVLKIEEKEGDPGSLSFKSQMAILGGEEAGLACPDNLVFDSLGHLWLTTDISASSTKKKEFATFKNNGLFYIPTTGPGAFRPLQAASAPVDAELTGPCFLPGEKELLLSIQHPGESSISREEMTSHWPEGGKSIPLSAVMILEGESLQELTGTRRPS